MNELLDLAVRIAKDAGELLLNRPEHLSIDTKSSDIDIVTQMDKASEKLIVDAILAARPDDGIVGEEGTDRPSKSGYTWVIDPIDGTVNYLYNMAGWSVSIAVKDAAGAAVGVVYSPTINSLFTAIRGGGSFLNGRNLKCNDPIELNRALIATGFAYGQELRQEQIKQFNDLILKIRDYRRNGSAAIDICHVAAGIVDGYYEMGLKEWDRAAAELVAREAGAKVSVHGELTIAAGPHLYATLCGHLLGPDFD
jgi:myo-inositol-1(or 4)-monophosphatase